MQNFETKLAEFRDKLEIFFVEHRNQNHPVLPVPTVELLRGSKYIRVVKKDPHASAYAFIAPNGDILKPAGWAAPAKHARGSIYNENPLEGCGPYGMAYLR